MHPRNDTRALPVPVGLVKQRADRGIVNQGRLPDHLIGKKSRLIQPLHDDSGMLGHLSQALVSVKVLGTRGKPKLVCFHLHKKILLITDIIIL